MIDEKTAAAEEFESKLQKAWDIAYRAGQMEILEEMIEESKTGSEVSFVLIEKLNQFKR